VVTINPGVRADAPSRGQEDRVVQTNLSSRLPRLVLASTSPRRGQLLAEAGLPHEATHPGIDDGLLAPGAVSADQWVAALAHLKAVSGAEIVRRSGAPVALVIGADTVCIKDGKFLGKPRDAADAERILRLLQDGSHQVVTGVALVRTDDPGWRTHLVDRATVIVGHLGDERIAAYVNSGQWRGKAGAYNLGERIEAGWPIKYQGDPTTVMGLPMKALLGRLGRLAGAADRLTPSVVLPTRLVEQSPDA
jgi:septum formation protein